MTLQVEMDTLDKDEFLIRCRKYHKTGSEVVRELIKNWMATHPDLQKQRMRPAVE